MFRTRPSFDGAVICAVVPWHRRAVHGHGHTDRTELRAGIDDGVEEKAKGENRADHPTGSSFAIPHKFARIYNVVKLAKFSHLVNGPHLTTAEPSRSRCIYDRETVRSSCCLRHPYRVMPRGLYTFSAVITSNTSRPTPGVQEVAPKLAELGGIRLSCCVCQQAHCRHVQQQDDDGKDGEGERDHDPIVKEQTSRRAH